MKYFVDVLNCLFLYKFKYKVILNNNEVVVYFI